MFAAAIPILGKLLGRLLPQDQAEKAKQELATMIAKGDQEIELIGTQLSAIVAEAQSNDPWTSRARPTFLYVVYAFILMAIPMGVLSAFVPDATTAIQAGVNGWLTALPEEIYWLFGTGYLGYTGARSLDKRKK